MTFVKEDIKGKLLFAIPKKGRLYEPCLDLLKGADIQFTRKTRLDIAFSTTLDVVIVFLPAIDIPKYIANGEVDIGISGMDVIEEEKISENIEILSRLGFGKCSLTVQVPIDSPFQDLESLKDKRVVTSFPNLTNTFFKSRVSVGYVSGSVEAACALGLADGIVDLVESGETMRAAQLCPIATIMKSEAVLIGKKNCLKNNLFLIIVSRINGIVLAKKHVLVKYNIQKENLERAIQITPGKRAPTISPLIEENWLAVEALIPKSKSAAILDELKKINAVDIIVFNISNSR
jgi:ATP phosphoribosyltransferase